MLLKIILGLSLSCIVTLGNRDTIPLDAIWALKMPGTRNIRELDPPKNIKHKTVINRIHLALFIKTTDEKPAGPCFLVTGEGKEALQKASKVIVDKEVPAKTHPTGKELTLFFYSNAAPGYVHIHSVERSESRITVNYQVVIHQMSNATVHFALIPLGHLPAGKFTVDIKEMEPPTPYSNQALVDRAVCDPCSFIIEKESVP